MTSGKFSGTEITVLRGVSGEDGGVISVFTSVWEDSPGTASVAVAIVASVATTDPEVIFTVGMAVASVAATNSVTTSVMGVTVTSVTTAGPLVAISLSVTPGSSPLVFLSSISCDKTSCRLPVLIMFWGRFSSLEPSESVEGVADPGEIVPPFV